MPKEKSWRGTAHAPLGRGGLHLYDEVNIAVIVDYYADQYHLWRGAGRVEAAHLAWLSSTPRMATWANPLAWRASLSLAA